MSGLSKLDISLSSLKSSLNIHMLFIAVKSNKISCYEKEKWPKDRSCDIYCLWTDTSFVYAKNIRNIYHVIMVAITKGSAAPNWIAEVASDFLTGVLDVVGVLGIGAEARGALKVGVAIIGGSS